MARKKKSLFRIASTGKKLSRSQIRSLIGEAKKKGTTAMDMVYNLIHDKASSGKPILMRQVHNICRNNINCGREDDYIMYKAIKRFNATNPITKAFYSSKHRWIQFMELKAVA